MTSIVRALTAEGPARASRVVATLTRSLGISPEAARQRLSRARKPVARIAGLLPKREAFLYLEKQHNTQIYWDHLLRDLRETGTVYACAIDGLHARGGVVPVDEFAVVSGAPIDLKKQVPATTVMNKLVSLGVMSDAELGGIGRCCVAEAGAIMAPLDAAHIQARRLTESVILDGLREWAWRNGIGSRHTIAIRGEETPCRVGQFKWDLTGPCYLLPLRRGRQEHGFVVADVFTENVLDVHHIRYFVRKVQVYQKSTNSNALFPIIVAEGFTGEAMTEGHKAGLMMATHKSLFGRHTAAAITSLMETLGRVAANVQIDGEALSKLLDQLSEIEGRAGNMRGLMFELLTAFLATHEYGGKTDLRVLHTHRRSGRKAEIDVLCAGNGNTVYTIECKSKIPDGTVSLPEVEQWIRKLPIISDYVANRSDLREYDQIHEFWTTGGLEPDALERLRYEQQQRTKRPIEWKDGKALRAIASQRKLKAVSDALRVHF
ncbi:hypothetical protein [Candidatus Palauibacter sp.]|uniref:hypothetical protein n=1 Tax=Candidatus Palauibacter sp. TaxID=3101350 RepID=UPI003B021133